MSHSWLLLFGAISLVVPTTGFAQTASLSLASASGTAGAPVSLNLTLAGTTTSTGVSSIQFTLNFSSTEFSSVAVSPADATNGSNKSLTCKASSGRLRCAVWGMNGTRVQNGVIATVTAIPSVSSPAVSRNISTSDVLAALADGSLLPAYAADTGTVSVSLPESAPASVLSSLTCPSILVSGEGGNCTVRRTGSTTSPMAVGVSDGTSRISVPSSVTINPGQTSTTFGVVASTFSTDSVATIRATHSGVTVTADVTLRALPALTSLTCAPSTIESGQSAVCTATLSRAADTLMPVALSTNTSRLTVPAAVSISSGSSSKTFTATAGTIQGATPAAVTAVLNGTSRTATVTLSPQTVGCPCSIFGPEDLPAMPTASDTSAVELGLKFQSKVSGYAIGVRFYKRSYNTGTHTGRLWSRSGQLLGSVTFQNETATGWQQANFSTPVAIAANTTYVISYRAPVGAYSVTQNYFKSTGAENGPLRALADGEDGGNSVFRYGNSAFPNDTFKSSNYYVDVVFNGQASGAATSVPISSEIPLISSLAAEGSTALSSGLRVSAPETEFIHPGERVSFIAAAERPGGEPVGILASGLPEGATFDRDTNRFEWTPAADQEGDFSPAFDAQTTLGEVASQATRISVGWGTPSVTSLAGLSCNSDNVATLDGKWLTAAKDEFFGDGSTDELGGTRVRLNGSPAPLRFVSPSRVELECPSLPAGSEVRIDVETATGSAQTVIVPLQTESVEPQSN